MHNGPPYDVAGVCRNCWLLRTVICEEADDRQHICQPQLRRRRTVAMADARARLRVHRLAGLPPISAAGARDVVRVEGEEVQQPDLPPASRVYSLTREARMVHVAKCMLQGACCKGACCIVHGAWCNDAMPAGELRAAMPLCFAVLT